MPSWIQRYKDADAALTANLIGRSRRSPIVSIGQQLTTDNQAAISKLPHSATIDAQVMTLGADYGKFYFIVGYSEVDGGDIILS
jgi:hypothetical protein